MRPILDRWEDGLVDLTLLGPSDRPNSDPLVLRITWTDESGSTEAIDVPFKDALSAFFSRAADALRADRGDTGLRELRVDLERRIADREPRADHYRNCGRITEAAAVDGAISAYRSVLDLLADLASPATAEPGEGK